MIKLREGYDFELRHFWPALSLVFGVGALVLALILALTGNLPFLLGAALVTFGLGLSISTIGLLKTSKTTSS